MLDTTYANLAALQAAVSTVDVERLERVHTTIGVPPLSRLAREREAMLPLPDVGFDPRVPQVRRVLSDCTVSLDGVRYSVPYRFVGTQVIVKADALGDGIEVYAGTESVARHMRGVRGTPVVIEDHVAELRRPRFERLRERAGRTKPASPPTDVRSVVPWPQATVEQRDIGDYADAVGGAR